MTYAIYLERGDLILKQYTADKIRNIALAGHGSDGKTSLTEAMLYLAGATDRLGSIADGNTVCDFDPEEIKRQISVSSAVAPLEYKGAKVNVIDTPGLFDFASGLYEGVRAADTVLITLSAKSGTLVGTEKAWKLASVSKKARAFFISKIDQENADYFKAFESLKENFGDIVCPIVVPVGGVYVNLIEKKAYKFEKGKAVEAAMPSDARLEELSMSIAETIANTSDDLMEKFFADEPFTAEEMETGLKQGLRDGTIAPVYCGDAITLNGVSLLLDAVVRDFPSAEEASSEVAEDADGKPVTIKCSADEPLAALVFKTVADPFVGKLSFVKVISGAISSALTPINSRTGQPERLGKMVIARGKQQDTVDSITAGDIGALTKLAEAHTGDTLCDPKRVVFLKKSDFPAPTMRMAIFSKSKGDESKVASSIARIMEEDATVNYEMDTETKQQILSGLGDQHLDVVVSKLKNKFGIELGLEAPHVAYRETIRKKVKVQGKHKKQSGGHGQYGDVWVEFEPTDSEDMVFEEAVFGGSVPKNFFPAVEKGLREASKTGMLAGYPMVGLLARLVDGSYHPVDSNDMSFQMAARLAYKAGIPQAGPVLLEPIGELKVQVPSSYAGDIMGDLNKRRGRVLGMNPMEDNITEVVAEVPMSETTDFTTALRSMTQGRGSFSLHFIRYDELPKMLEASVIEAAKQWMAAEEE
ncbi:MAG TPA: elongation factor G [Oscillospiraceae bacterium]|nr:elongation factor G [Oscillospiraceae bacterium]HXK77660.1 elongation factor G [Oscillospiraceae bacterium]